MNATALSGIEFVVDKRGRQKAVLINLGRHSALWEDVYDSMLERNRRSEPRTSLAQLKQRLMAKPGQRPRG